MNRVQLLNLHIDLCSAARDLTTNKNQDYAEEGSIFGNLDLVEALFRGEMTTEQGILVRMGDKLSRLVSASKRDLAVKDESARDTVLDVINYVVLWYAKHQEREEQGGKKTYVLQNPQGNVKRIKLSEQGGDVPDHDLQSDLRPPTRISVEPHRVYVAGPYSDPDPIQRRKNANTAMNLSRAVLCLGHYVHCPHAATEFMDNLAAYDYFMDLDEGIIRRWATALFRIRGPSPGADREVAIAKEMGIPIWYGLDEVPEAKLPEGRGLKRWEETAECASDSTANHGK